MLGRSVKWIILLIRKLNPVQGGIIWQGGLSYWVRLRERNIIQFLLGLLILVGVRTCDERAFLKTAADEILNHLKRLIGLKLSIARRAADLRNFQFGPVRLVDNGTVGEFALHIQCPWCIEGPDGIVTGRLDLWEPAEVVDDFDWESWDYETGENLQDKRIGTLLGGYDPQTRSFVNTTSHLVVTDVETDCFGGAAITLSGGFRLVLFPAGTQGEDWRLFRPGIDEPHFVVRGGAVDEQ